MTAEPIVTFRRPQSANTQAIRRRRGGRPPGRPAVVLAHGLGAPGTILLEALHARSFRASVLRVDGDRPLPEPSTAELAVIIGHPAFADAQAGGHLDRELEWIRKADLAGVAILGIGHGARALALALGGAVATAPEVNRGWTLLDTVAPHLVPAGPWVAWQHDIITAPDGATTLAANRYGPQAFRIGRHLGVQFHPETSVEAVAKWLPQTAATRAITDPDPVFRGLRRDPEAADACARTLFTRFLDTVVAATPALAGA